MGQHMGEKLNEAWGVGARHALFHREGTWYHQLKRFPGALFDDNGYVVFQWEQEFQSCPNLQIGQDVNVDGHISDIPGYVRVPPDKAYDGTW